MVPLHCPAGSRAVPRNPRPPPPLPPGNRSIPSSAWSHHHLLCIRHPPPPPPSLTSAPSSPLSPPLSPLSLPHSIPTPPPPLPPPPPPPSSRLRLSPSTVPIPLPAPPRPYSNCPAVVRSTTTPSPPAASSLPAFLASQCADYSSSPETVDVSVPSSPPRVLLPSELCLLRREVDSWSTHGVLPGSYSHAAACVVAAALRSGLPLWEAELRRWVLATSPRYGVVIDVVTTDHVWVLVRLCLKAAASEACCSLENVCNAEGGGSGFDPRAIRFECPRLVDGVSWLGAQLRILYGEGSGRSFAILHVGSFLAVGVDSSGGGEAGASGGAGVEGSDFGNVGTSSVFVAQVVAAISALHVRFSLEEKIKALRAPWLLKYQLLLEYSQSLERGHKERSKRPNYRAVLEYDGIISRRVDSQESGRAKTREELLAEERDYKRRRTSYRGKKVKRNPKEILRDIIDEHMEEIKQAGGIGCLLDASGDIAQSMLKNSPQRSFNPTSSSYGKEVFGLQSVSCEKLPCANPFGIVSSRNHGTSDSYKDLRKGSHQCQYQKVSDDENRRIKDSESMVDHRYSHHHENSRHQRNSDDHRKYGYKYEKDGSDYYSESSGCTRWPSEREYDCMSRVRSNDISTTSHTRHRSVSVTQDKFSDRYDPQSTNSDVDPATSMLNEGSIGQREIYHDGTHHRRKHDRHY